MSDHLGHRFQTIEFMDNPEPRCPCVLLLDTSASMRGAPIDELNAGMRVFKQELVGDTLASLRVEVAIVTFGGTVAVAQEFVSVSHFTPPTLSVSGNTPMGQAIHSALNLLKFRKDTYQNAGIAFYRPWLFMITDGAPTDPWADAAQRLQEEEHNKKVMFFAVGVTNADLNVLSQIGRRAPLRLQGLRFSQMFQWLSRSMTSVANSNPGDRILLQSPLDWAQLEV